jgi:hypothetical protein
MDGVDSKKQKPVSILGTTEFLFAVIFALLALGLHILAIQNYGYFRDELYYIACSDHLAFGYVDQPPLAMALLKIIRTLLGDSLLALRIVPALASAAFILLTALLARELGGNKPAVILAAAAAFAPIGNFFAFHYYSMNFWDLLFWQVIILIVIRIIKTDNPRLWLLFGFVAGLGLQNKISVLFLGFGIVVGLLLTPKRRHLTTRHFWLGGGIAGLLFLPYIVWNWAHDWPHLEFIHNARTFKMAAVSPLEFFTGQVLYNNPATLLIWLAGLVYLLFHKEGRQYRLFGWMFLAIYILFTLQQAKDYYLAGAYPILFAGGAVVIGKGIQKKNWIWLTPVLVAFILIPTFIFAPITLPILPVETTIAHMQRIGIVPSTGERHELSQLPQHYADMFGWEEMAAVYAQAYRKLSPEEQAKCLIFVRNYGEAGAIDFFGRAHGLPRAMCTHNNYWLWGPGDVTGEVGIVLGMSSDIEESRQDLEAFFEEVELAGIFRCQYCMPYENNAPIFICRNMKVSLQEIWDQEKHYN